MRGVERNEVDNGFSLDACPLDSLLLDDF